MVSYTYTALPNPPSIRLLSLNPFHEHEGQLSGAFVIATPKEAPEFEVISYVWGQADLTESIQIEGECYVPITSSLASALRRFRTRDSVRLLWVDGVCIDQKNTDEKAVQVPLMASIYQSATRTLAWLGEGGGQGDGHLDQAFEFIRDKANVSEAADEEAYPHDGERGDQMRLDAAQRDQIELLFQNSWFTRLWIAQEAILSQDLQLHFGKYSIAWRVFNIFIHQIPKLNIELSNTARAGLQYAQDLSYASSDWGIQLRARHIFPNLDDDWRSSRLDTFPLLVMHAIKEAKQSRASGLTWKPPNFSFNRGHIFMDILWSLQSRHCKDDRDRIYAALGFLPWDIPLKVIPDYSRSIRDVYTGFAKALLELHYVEVLLYAGLWDRVSDDSNADADATNGGDSCPSWVPELRLSKLKTGTMNAWDHPMLNELIKTLETPRIVEDERLPLRRIYIKGVMFDKITGGRQWMGDCGSFEDLIWALRLCSIGFVELKGQQTDIETFVKLLGVVADARLGAVGRDDPKDIVRLQNLIFGGVQELLVMLAVGPELTFDLWLFHEAEEVIGTLSLVQFLIKKLSHRMFFTTEKGECGLAPAMAEPGDVLVRFMGQGVECLIRPVVGSGDFRLIGPCYYHGIPQLAEGSFGFIPLV